KRETRNPFHSNTNCCLLYLFAFCIINDERMKNKKINKKVVSYIIRKLKERNSFFGKVQVMKLMFLVDHLNLENDKIERKSLLGNDYYIYYLGPMSFEVLEVYDNLKEEEIEKLEPEGKIKEKVDEILKNYGNKDGFTLQKICMEKLGIKEKGKYFGFKISEIVKKCVISKK
ncbi:MAG: hypothetical protein ACP5JZ_07490, partial [Thermosulfidibacteraceae bacterium]